MSASQKAGILLAVVIVASLFGSSHDARAERLPIKSYTITDGLARDEITRIVRDSRGFLWFCTPDGLSRFDGYRFINYGTDQGLPGRAVNDLLETRSGVYWIATSGGLARFNPYPTPPGNTQRGDTTVHRPAFVPYHLPDETRARSVYALCEDQAGTVWCGAEANLYRMDEVDGEWKSSIVDLGPPTKFGSANAYVVLEDHTGALWVGTGFGLFRRRQNGVIERFGAEQGIPLADRNTLLEDREGTLWLGTGSGLFQLVPHPEVNRSAVARVYTSRDGLGSNFVTSLFQSSDGRLWIGTDNALHERLPAANKDGELFKKYTSANGASAALSISEDRDGNLWIGTETHGAMKIAANGFTTYGPADGIGETRIGQVSEDRAGELCLFSGPFVHRFDGSRFTAVRIHLPKGITKGGWGWYQFMLQDHTGEWWMCSGQGLIRYPKSSKLEQLAYAPPKAVYGTSDGLSGNEIFRVFEDSHGDIWVGTLDAPQYTLSRWERRTGKWHRYLPGEAGIPTSTPTAFFEDSSGLWIGFYGGSVARHRDGRFTLFTKDDGLPAGFIRQIHLDRAGRLWIATGDGGVARVDDPAADHPHFVAYTTADGLSSNQITCVTEDLWGRIYIGTGRGVDRLDTKTGRIKHYTTADGLASNFVNVSFRDREGALWFGTLDGLSRFIPEADRVEPPPSILIGGLRVAGVGQTISELGETRVSGLKLEANQNELEMDFFGLSFAPGESLRYQYELEGAHQDWSPLTGLRSVNYPNLAPGTYRFLVRALSADGVASLSPATIEFSILPPIWQRGWFLAIAAILAGVTAYSLYRYRVARLIEVERMRTRIATDLHDDIGSGLSQVSVLSEVMQRRAGFDPRMSEPLGMIAGLSRDLIDSMNDIVWAINPNRDHLSDLAQRMRRFASDVFTARDIEFSFAGPDSQHNIRLGADMRREVFLIFKESVNNMVRHSGCTEARIDFIIESRSLELKIGDNGKGFNLHLEEGGNGLASMRQRAERIGGRLDICSDQVQGTTVRLSAPIGRQRWMKR